MGGPFFCPVLEGLFPSLADAGFACPAGFGLSPCPFFGVCSPCRALLGGPFFCPELEGLLPSLADCWGEPCEPGFEPDEEDPLLPEDDGFEQLPLHWH